jgi:hypothetical protein
LSMVYKYMCMLLPFFLIRQFSEILL